MEQEPNSYDPLEDALTYRHRAHNVGGRVLGVAALAVSYAVSKLIVSYQNRLDALHFDEWAPEDPKRFQQSE